MKTKIPVLISVAFLLCLLVAPAFAADSYTYYGPTSNAASFMIRTLAPSTDAYWSNVGESFNCSTTGYLHTITVYGQKQGSPVGTVHMELCGVDGTFGTDNTPNVTVYAETTLSAAAFSSLGGQVTFTFNATYLIEAGDKYGFNMYVVGTSTYNSSNYVYLKGTASNVEDGNTYHYTASAWVAVATDEIYTKVLVSDTPGESEPEEPEETFDTSTADTLITSFVNFMVPIIVMLLPALLLCFITKRVDKWLLLIGLAIGAGLGYYFAMVPLWLVFLVVIGLIGMAYQSVRGGG